MLHFSCDVCGQVIDDQRFEVRLEVIPAHDPVSISAHDLESDNLQQIADQLQQLEESGETCDDPGPRQFRYDLCGKCHARFVQDPLRRDALRRLSFSEN